MFVCKHWVSVDSFPPPPPPPPGAIQVGSVNSGNVVEWSSNQRILAAAEGETILSSFPSPSNKSSPRTVNAIPGEHYPGLWVRARASPRPVISPLDI